MMNKLLKTSIQNKKHQRFLVVSGFVEGNESGEFVDCAELIRLYEVNPMDCVCIPIKKELWVERKFRITFSDFSELKKTKEGRDKLKKTYSIDVDQNSRYIEDIERRIKGLKGDFLLLEPQCLRSNYTLKNLRTVNISAIQGNLFDYLYP